MGWSATVRGNTRIGARGAKRRCGCPGPQGEFKHSIQCPPERGAKKDSSGCFAVKLTNYSRSCRHAKVWLWANTVLAAVSKREKQQLVASWRGLWLESSHGDPATEQLERSAGGPGGACGSFETSERYSRCKLVWLGESKLAWLRRAA